MGAGTTTAHNIQPLLPLVETNTGVSVTILRLEDDEDSITEMNVNENNVPIVEPNTGRSIRIIRLGEAEDSENFTETAAYEASEDDDAGEGTTSLLSQSISAIFGRW